MSFWLGGIVKKLLKPDLNDPSLNTDGPLAPAMKYQTVNRFWSLLHHNSHNYGSCIQPVFDKGDHFTCMCCGLGPVHTYLEICENVHTYPAYFPAVSGNFWKRSPEWKFFLSDTNTYTCGRSYPEICEYAYVILLDPVFTASIKQTWRTATLCLLC